MQTRRLVPYLRKMACLAAVVALGACDDTDSPGEPDFGPTPPGEGPKVVYDITTLPIPDIPFPNDIATRVDETTGTGLRLDVPQGGATRLERDVRRQLNSLDGWGTYSSITVRFDAPLDLDNLIARHQENRDFNDDAVLVVNIDPESPEFGEPAFLDMGRGYFPALIDPELTTYHPSDPRYGTASVLFETVDEDTDGDGVLDPMEDTDNDGVLDRANVWPVGAPVDEGLLTFYERQTDTLIMRPVRPLREATEYAVVLTNRLVGENAEAVRSPLDQVYDPSQAESVDRLRGIFATSEWGITAEDVSFVWTFTTQSVTADLVALREGLYGIGPFAGLAADFPAGVVPALATSAEDGSPYALPGAALSEISQLAFAAMFGLSGPQVEALANDMEAVDYVVQGSFRSPNLLGDPDVPWVDQTMRIDRLAGTYEARAEDVTFIAVVPKATDAFQPPFPVAVYSHGFGQARVEPLAFASILAKYGIATVGIDTWGHGLNLSRQDADLMLLVGENFDAVPFLETLLEGRGTDFTGSGRIDAGADMYSSYAFHTRDTMRQSALEHFQLVRVLRAFDGTTTWRDVDGLAGDFNQDGVVDFGGPDVAYGMWGSSMGGLLTGLVAPVEPAITMAAPVAGGAGLSGFGRRSRQESVRGNTVMGVIGPVIAGTLTEDGVDVRYYYPLANKVRDAQIGVVDVQPGDAFTLTNETLGLSRSGTVRADGGFHMPLRADEGDRFALTFERDGDTVAELRTWASSVVVREDEPPVYEAGEPLAALNEGWGYHRGSPEFRRMVGLAQTVLEPGDPINYQRHMFLEPLDVRPEGPTQTNLLVMATVGDMMNPSDVHVAAAMAAGVLDPLAVDDRYGMPASEWLIDNGVLEGLCGVGRTPNLGYEVLFDPDALHRTTGRGENANEFGAPVPSAGEELRAILALPDGVAGMRYGHMLPCGKHSFFITDPSNPFNVDAYLNSLAGHFFATGGREIRDDGCHETATCSVP